MDTIPQELIDSILNEVTDMETLKACALVASIFRPASQRILLRSVVLGGDTTPQRYQTVWDNLQESPRIASYVRTLLLILPDQEVFPEAGSSLLPALMGKLTNVSQLLLTGATEYSSWDDLPPGMAEMVLDVIRQPALEGFHILSIGQVPIDLLGLVCFSVASTSLVGGSINFQTSTPLEISPTSSTITLENLLFFDDCENLGDILANKYFVPCMANLRRLWVRLGEGDIGTILAAAAPKLEELYFDCTGMPSFARWPPCDYIATYLLPHADLNFDEFPTPEGPLPDLPSLRFAGIRLEFDDRDRPWVVDTLCALLSSSTTEEVVITYPCEYIFQPEIWTLSPTTMDALNKVLRGRTVFPRLRWRLDFDDMDDDDGTFLRDFKAAVEEGIPIARDKGKLVVECVSLGERLFTWPGGTIMLPVP
ncbi:hypothetical protein B0H11DRAFT_590761 [Mycena galericulata]|nr:hypothetical protein B0H11DRAFT_590761 [Mycena galericulata]